MTKNLETYSIGIYEGSSPFDLSPMGGVDNPIISRSSCDISNVNFCADPFGVYENGTWYLFFEIMPVDSRKGKIYVKTSSNLTTWSDAQLVLEEPFHISYPQVFKHDGTYYMVPETYESNEVRLYQSITFPFEWKFKKTLLNRSCVDSTLFFHEQYWWMFTCDAPSEHNRLRLFYTNDLMEEWTEHPASPIYQNNNSKSRPGGKVFCHKNKLYRLAQDCEPFYGSSVRVFEIINLNVKAYSEIELDENPILEKGNKQWNKVSMHHLDVHHVTPDKVIAFVDGRAN